MKYIIVKDRDEKEFGILFPDAIMHMDVARIHCVRDVTVVAAGFCHIGTGDTTTAWGKSDSMERMDLPRESRLEDAGLDRDFNPNHGK